jgi:uncharacterized coiled-coil DUF342 family protein
MNKNPNDMSEAEVQQMVNEIRDLRHKIYSISAEIAEEAARAHQMWEPFQSAHEGYAVILEELDELKEHVWKNQTRRDIKAMRTEAIQVAAMALRFVMECCNEDVGRRPRAKP